MQALLFWAPWVENPADAPVDPASFSDRIAVSPNPASRSVHIRYESRDLAAARLEVYDPRGRLVTKLAGSVAGAADGFGQLEWDLRDRSGKDVPPGRYFVVLSPATGMAGPRQVQALTVIR